MRKNTDLHLKIRTVTAQKRFGELPQVLRRVLGFIYILDWTRKCVSVSDTGFRVGT